MPRVVEITTDPQRVVRAHVYGRGVSVTVVHDGWAGTPTVATTWLEGDELQRIMAAWTAHGPTA